MWDSNPNCTCNDSNQGKERIERKIESKIARSQIAITLIKKKEEEIQENKSLNLWKKMKFLKWIGKKQWLESMKENDIFWKQN